MQRASNALATGPATLGCRPDQHFGPAAQPAALTGSPTNRPPSFMSPRRPPLQATRAICIIKPAHLARHSSALVMRRRFDGNLSAGSSPSAPPGQISQKCCNLPHPTTALLEKTVRLYSTSAKKCQRPTALLRNPSQAKILPYRSPATTREVRDTERARNLRRQTRTTLAAVGFQVLQDLLAGVHAAFGVDALDVGVGRGRGNVELVGHLLLGVAQSVQGEHVHLAVRK